MSKRLNRSPSFQSVTAPYDKKLKGFEKKGVVYQKYLEYKDMVVGEGREIFQGENFRERLFIPFSFLVR